MSFREAGSAAAALEVGHEQLGDVLEQPGVSVARSIKPLQSNSYVTNRIRRLGATARRHRRDGAAKGL